MHRSLARALALTVVLSPLFFVACSDDGSSSVTAHDPTTAEKAAIDRFSDLAGHLQKRSDAPGLPAANAPVDFDQGPFITDGFGPQGEHVRYYNFDVQPLLPAPIYVFFDAAGAPVAGQLNVVDTVPGAAGYNDFWRVNKVTVPAGYVANTAASYDDIVARGYAVAATDMLVNCPIVPEGSTATLRLGSESPALHTGWYRGKTVRYFSFEEKALSGAMVPLAPIFVTFNVNPDQAQGGPGSGFKTEAGSPQTHNVIATLPSQAGYSPLWSVNVYDNTAFPSVTDLAKAEAATELAAGVATVNCPVVAVQ